jgi:hypothetical protein
MTDNKFTSRKLLIMAGIFVASTTFVFTGHMEIEQFMEMMKWAFLTYAGANAVTKFSSHPG